MLLLDEMMIISILYLTYRFTVVGFSYCWLTKKNQSDM